jgi:hypothetical protein
MTVVKKQIKINTYLENLLSRECDAGMGTARSIPEFRPMSFKLFRRDAASVGFVTL